VSHLVVRMISQARTIGKRHPLVLGTRFLALFLLASIFAPLRRTVCGKPRKGEPEAPAKSVEEAREAALPRYATRDWAVPALILGIFLLLAAALRWGF